MKKTIIVLNISLLFFSISNVFGKLAGNENFLSLKYCIFQCCMIGVLGIYAIVWQQIIKKVPLTTAYMNKAVTVLWTALWGVTLFKEKISAGQVAGMIIVVIGVVLFSLEDARAQKSDAASSSKNSEVILAEETLEMQPENPNGGEEK